MPKEIILLIDPEIGLGLGLRLEMGVGIGILIVIGVGIGLVIEFGVQLGILAGIGTHLGLVGIGLGIGIFNCENIFRAEYRLWILLN